jgi:MFS family permease
MIRTNYAPTVRGKMYAWMQLVTILGTILAAKLCAWLLDHDPRWLRVLFPVAGVLGLTSFLLLARIRWRRQRRLLARPHPHEGIVAAWISAWRETARILREDRDFRTYEIGFMAYGVGFLASVPLLVLYAEERLALSYGQYTWATAAAFPLAQIAAMAAWGRLSDRWGVVRTTAVAFLGLSAFFFSMTLVSGAVGLVIAYAIWGLAMAGVDVGWSLGPLHFAPDDQAHMYAAVHFCMVGIRSVVAPFLGFAVKSWLGFAPAFAMSGGLLVVAALVVASIGRRRVS